MQSAYTISSLTEQDLHVPSAVFEDLISHHSPFAAHLFGWIDAAHGLASGYLPMAHDIELHDGTVIERCFAGGKQWIPIDEGDVTAFTGVARVRLSQQQPTMTSPWEQRGADGALQAPL